MVDWKKALKQVHDLITVKHYISTVHTYHAKREMHGRDIWILRNCFTVSLWFNNTVIYYSSLFQWATMVSTPVENSKTFWYTCLLTFLEIIIVTWTHAYHIKWMALCTPVIVWKLKPLFSALFNLCYTAVWINSCSKSSFVIKVATMKNTPMWKEAITCCHQIDTFHCQQRWMAHKGRHW